MSKQAVKIPGPDHPIVVEASPKRVIVKVEDRVIADTAAAQTLREADYPPIQYIPRDDIDMTALTRTDHASHCPYKGDASYFSIPAGGARSRNAAWSYEAPHDAVATIRGLIAFYPDRVGSIEEAAAD